MNNLNFQETFPAKFASIVPEKVSKHTFVFRACPLCCLASVVSGVTEISLVSSGNVDRRGHRASVKRQETPVITESRLKIDGPEKPAHLISEILF